MKKFIIILILLIIAVYIFSGRYAIVKNNFEKSGPKALLDEPAWLCEFVGDQWNKIKTKIDNFIEGETIGPKYEE